MPRALRSELIAHRLQQRRELIMTTVNVADDVEWPMLVAPVVVEPLPHELNAFDLVRRVELEHIAEPFAAQRAERLAHQIRLPPDDVRSELPVGP
jgi:hypothetical protein